VVWKPSSMDVPLFSPVSTWCPQWCLRRSVPLSSRTTSPNASSLVWTCRRPAPVYEVNIHKAVSSKVDRLSNDIEDAIKKKSPDVTVAAKARRHHCVFQESRRPAGVDAELLKPYRRELDEVNRDASGPRCGCATTLTAWPSGGVGVAQAIETIRAAWTSSCGRATIIKKGTDIVSTACLKQSDFERIKSIIGRTAQLEFKIVDDGTEYMKKLVPACQGWPHQGRAGKLDREATRASSTKTYFCAAKIRPGLESSSLLCRRLAVPPIASWCSRRSVRARA